MKINDFSGGIQTRLSPRQLAGNQATECVNVDFRSTDLKPFKKVSTFAQYESVTGHSFVDFKGTVYAQSASGYNPLDPNLPTFLTYLDDLYCIKEVGGSVGVLHRLVNGNFVRIGYNREQLSASVTGQLLTATTTSEKTYYGSTTVISILYEQQVGITHSYTDTTVFEGIRKLLNLLKQATSSTTAGNYEISLDLLTASNIVEKTTYAYDTPTQSTTYVDYLARYDISYKLDGVTVVSGSDEHTAIVANLGGLDYLTEPLDTALNNLTGVPLNRLTVPIRPRLVDTATLHTYTYVITLYSSAAEFETSYLGEIYTVDSHETKQNTLVLSLRDGGVFPVESIVDITYFDEVRIYRSGNGATLPTLIHSEPTASFVDVGDTLEFTFVDTDLTEDSYLTAGRLFDTLDVGEVPLYITHGVQIGNRIMLASENKLYGSELGNQDSFPLINVIEFNESIVALAESHRGLLVFFESQTYLVRQRSDGRFSKTLVSKDQGCTTSRSIQHIGNVPYWFSHDGFCTLLGDKVRILSKGSIANEDFTLVSGDPSGLTKVLSSGHVNEKYYAVQYFKDISTTRVFVYDMSYGRAVPYYLETDFFQITNFAVIDGELHCVIGDKLYEMFGSSYGNINDFETYKYHTGLLVEGSITKRKTYDDAYFFTLDDYPVKVTMFDEQGRVMAIKSVVKRGLHNMKIKTGEDDAYGVSFLLEGKATVAEIEYKIKGRSNGK